MVWNARDALNSWWRPRIRLILSPTLESLSQLAPKLNKATHLYMDELKEIEQGSNKFNLGTAVELEQWIQQGNSKSEYNDDGEPTGVFYSAWSLGYRKDNRGEWHLLIREDWVTRVPRGPRP